MARSSLREHDAGSIRRLEYAPHHVYLVLEDGELKTVGESEQLDAGWLSVDEVRPKNDAYWCRACDASFATEAEAIEHLQEELDDV